MPLENRVIHLRKLVSDQACRRARLLFPDVNREHAYTSDQTLTLHRTLFSAETWFSSTGLQEVSALISRYSYANGGLPGDIPEEAISSLDWRNRIASFRSDLRCTLRVCVEYIFNFMQAIFFRLSMPLNQELIPSEFSSESWVYRTRVKNYTSPTWWLGITWTQRQKRKNIWRDCAEFRHKAIFWVLPILPNNFRELKHGDVFFLTDIARWEIKARAEFGHLLAYQMIEAAQLRRRSMHSRYVGCQIVM